MANFINYGAQGSSESIDNKFESIDDSHPTSPTKTVISRVVEL
jgi:hypothetical protein